MKIKLANTSDFIYISNINRSLFIDDTSENSVAPVEKITIGVEDATGDGFDSYKNYFQNGDVSVIEVYNSKDDIIVTFNGKSVEAITQNINENGINICVTINV